MTANELLVEALVELHPTDAARALERVRPPEAAALLNELAPGPAASVLARIDGAFAAAALEELESADAAKLVAGLPPAAAAVLLRRLPPPARLALLAASPPAFAKAVRAVLAHPARSAGALMDPDGPSLPRDLTASAALSMICERPARFKHYVYVVDRDGALVGVTRLLDVVGAPPETRLEELMRTPVARLQADELEVAVLAHPGWRTFTSLPVVDREDRLVGVIRDDVVRSLQESARATQAGAPVSLAVSLAELLWLGLTGVTEGVASVVGRETARHQAELEREAEKPR